MVKFLHFRIDSEVEEAERAREMLRPPVLVNTDGVAVKISEDKPAEENGRLKYIDTSHFGLVNSKYQNPYLINSFGEG